MWSPRYNRWWGCRCCAKPAGRKLHVNGNWELWAGGSYTPPPPPPPTPVPTVWPTALGAKPPHLVLNARGCARQLGMVCKKCTAQQCVGMASANSRCGGGDGSVMWSPRYNKWWGCRCCAKAQNTGQLHRNTNWQLWAGGHYTKPPPPPPTPAPKPSPFGLIKKGRSCRSQAAYLGKNHRSWQQCYAAALRNSRCRQAGSVKIMWAPRYNRWWGCRCCRQATPYRRNGNWDMYG